MAKAPGKAYRQGLTLLKIADKFGNEEDARKWIESKRWPNGPHCPHCGSYNVQSDINHKTMTLQGFVEDNTEEETTVYTDDAKAYVGLDRPHQTVCHSVGEYVKGMAHTNGMESFWALMKRGYSGTCHKMSPKHLSRYRSG